MVFDLSGTEYCWQRTTHTTKKLSNYERGIIMIKEQSLFHNGYFIQIMPNLLRPDEAMININCMRVRSDCKHCQNKAIVLMAIAICHLERDIEVVDFWVNDDGTIVDDAISILNKSTFKTDLDEFLKVYEKLS